MFGRISIGASVMVVTALSTAPAASAQEVQSNTAPAASLQPQSDEHLVEEVIVTARLRSEGLQNAPVAVTVTTAEAIERAGVTSVLDLPRVAPGLIVERAPASLDTGVTIRGLGSSSGAFSFESSVGFFANGVYLPRARQFSSALFDVDHIEVVRGTQSSLLGKNTSLGAVNLITRAPGREFEGNLSVTREFELGSWTVAGGASMPLSDTLSVRVAGIYDDQDGWVRNDLTGREGGGGTREGGRITFAWTPSSAFDATLLYETQHIEVVGFTTELLASNAVVDNLTALAGVPNFETHLDRRSANSDSRLPDGYIDEDEVQRASLTAHWKFRDHVLMSQTAWSDSSGSTAAATDFLPGDYFLYRIDTETSAISQEFRLTSPGEDRLRYALGVWLGRNTVDLPDDWNLTYPAPPNGVGSNHWTGSFSQTTESWSVFGQADYDITQHLTLSGGLRYTGENKDVDLARDVLVPGVLTGPGGYQAYAPFSLSRSESVTDGLVNLRYTISDDLMVYVAWAQGTKSGGFAQNTSLLDQSEYRPEVAQTTELGVRYQTGDRTLTVNATVFSTDVSDYQLVTFNGVQFVVDNTDLKSTGIETQLTWRPRFLPGLTIDWSSTYADSKDAITDGRIPNAPRWTGQASLNYEHALAGGFSLIVNGGASYESSQTRQQDPNYPPPSEAITMYNASIGLESGAGYSIRLYGRNLTDENRTVFAFPTPFAGPPSYLGVSERPRTIALDVSYRF